MPAPSSTPYVRPYYHITTVVTVISEHPQAVAAVASIYGVAKPFLAKILGPSADELGEIGRDYIKGRRAKNAERTLVDADKLLAETGREPQEVPLAVVVPLLEAASLQEEPTLADRWAALLANAADSAQSAPVQPGFVEVLRQLTTDDAYVLAFLYNLLEKNDKLTVKDGREHIKWPDDRLDLSLDNLLRLRLFETRTGDIIGSVSPFTPHADIAHTRFGLAFLAAVTPPIA